VSFFICQAQLPQDDVDRLQGTLQPRCRPHFLEGEIVLSGQQGANLASVGGHNHGFAPGEAVPWSDVTGAPTLLEELLDQAQRNPKTVGHLSAGALIIIVSS
jgi:hypothetical protein